VGYGELQTITLSSEEFGGKPTDEGPIAAAIARHLGVQNRQQMIGIREFEEDLEPFLAAMDQPTIDGLNIWFVAKVAADTGLKVALSGLGGDEVLGGYWTFQKIPKTISRTAALAGIPGLGTAFLHLHDRLVAPFPRSNPATGGLLRYGNSPAGAYLLERAVVRPWELHHVLDRDLIDDGAQRLESIFADHYSSERSDLNPFAQVAFLEGTRYMRNQLLRDSDWAGMAHSLEIRVPLADTMLTDRLMGLAATGRLPGGKQSLGRSLRNPLPESIIRRPKTGFTIPIWKWLRKSARADGWKRNAFLRRRNIHDFARWAYIILQHTPEAAPLLK
jgi:asparagine synthase (glutamine-hydrolysing)